MKSWNFDNEKFRNFTKEFKFLRKVEISMFEIEKFMTKSWNFVNEKVEIFVNWKVEILLMKSWNFDDEIWKFRWKVEIYQGIEISRTKS